jgi:hypothetical protein
VNSASYEDVLLGAQLLVEEKYGTVLRAPDHEEDDQYAATKAALRAEQRELGGL